MPRGGHNKKSVIEHMKNGTYRPVRHGVIFEEDIDILSEIKKTVFDEFNKAKTVLNDKTTKPEDLEKSKEDLIDYAKLYHTLSVKVPPKKESKTNDDDGSVISSLINKKEL